MTITELIAKLEAVKAERGDLLCTIGTSPIRQLRHITPLDYDSSDFHPRSNPPDLLVFEV